jgi:hypothetical protein
MSNTQVPVAPVEVFYSYSRKDERLRARLETHLKGLKLTGIITDWHDRRIVPGTEWERVIDDHINSARIILLLISPDYIASDYAYGIEAKRALERHRTGDAQVIPVILRPDANFSDTPFSKLQALPTDGKPVTTWTNRDEAFKRIVDGIKVAISRPWPPYPPTRRPLLYGDVVKLQHRDTSRWLHSHETTYVHKDSSGQQEVTAFAGDDENDYWLVRGPHGQPRDHKKGESVRRGDVIRLEHVRTTRNLHSHGVRAPRSDKQQEVSCFGNWGNGNSGDNWQVEEIDGDEEVWQWGSIVKLAHEETGLVLHSHDEQYRDDHYEVTCSKGRDNNDWWKLSQ